MDKTLRITKNQPFVLWLPTIMLNASGKEEVDASTLSDITIKATSIGNTLTPEQTFYEHWIILSFAAVEKAGVYDVEVTATLNSGRQIQLNIKQCFEVVNWDYQSNWQDYIVGDHIELCDMPFITGSFTTDAEYVALKQELNEKIAAAEQAQADAEAAKAQWEQKIAEADDLAQQSTLTEGISNIRGDISEIDFDTSDLAKQGSNAEATNTAIYEKVANAEDLFDDYASQLREIVGTE